MLVMGGGGVKILFKNYLIILNENIKLTAFFRKEEPL